MKSTEIIYLTYPIQNNKNIYNKDFHNKLSSFFDIPEEFCKSLKLMQGVHSLDSINYVGYICPQCGVPMLAEWICWTKVSLSQKYAKDDNANETVKRINSNFEDFSETAYSDVTAVGNLDCCPICNAHLIKKYPFTSHNMHDYSYKLLPKACKSALKWTQQCEVPSFSRDSQSRQFSHSEYNLLKAKEAVEEHLRAVALNKADDFIQKCEEFTPKKQSNTEANTILIKMYLMHLIHLESNIMCMSQRLHQLYVMKAENDRDIAFDSNYHYFETKQSFENNIEHDTLLLAKARAELNNLEHHKAEFQKIRKPSPPKEPILLKANFFNKKRIEEQNATALAEYREALNKYNETLINIDKENALLAISAEKEKEENIAKVKKKIEKYEKTITVSEAKLAEFQSNKVLSPTPSLATKQMIDQEITLIENTLEQSIKCKISLYDYNIVYDKYRNIVALSTFFEYFDSGRCETLEGATGAYNLYENELRLNMIITQLDDIKNKLDDIKQNQYIIYKTMKRIESTLHSLESSMQQAVSSINSIDQKASTMSKYLESISNNTEVIAYNSAVSAYYSERNAELADALGFMVALG